MEELDLVKTKIEVLKIADQVKILVESDLMNNLYLDILYKKLEDIKIRLLKEISDG